MTETTANEPNQFELHGENSDVLFDRTTITGQPQLTYNDRSFSGGDIDVRESPFGTLVTVTLEVIFDGPTTTFTLLVPNFNLKVNETECSTLGVVTTHAGAFAAQLLPEQLTSFQAVTLRGRARVVMPFGNGQTAGPPSAIFQVWLHAHEEDTDEVSVYHPKDWDFPPTRGRTGFKVKQSGEFIEYRIAAGDGWETVGGRWEAAAADRLTVTLEGSAEPSYTLQILSCDERELRIRKPLPAHFGGAAQASNRRS